MKEGGFNFQKLIDDSKSTLLSPKAYFSSMAKEGGYIDPIIKAAAYGIIAGLISLFWSVLGLKVVGATSSISNIIIAPLYALIGLFIGALILLLISAICSGDTSYEANLRVAASLSLLFPINAILWFTYGINITFGSIISIVRVLYGIWLLYNSLVHALSGKEDIAKIISIILAIIPTISILGSLVCFRAVTNVTDDVIKESDKIMMELPNEQRKAIEEYRKMSEKHLEKLKGEE